nr:aldo/keto reductase [Salinibacter sp. 10B]
MEYTTLGSTGLEVSRICLGCMSFGATGWKDWLLDEEKSRRLIEGAIERGINFFDTANMYSHGDSERILGEVLSDHNREEMVVATKVYFPPSEEPHRHATGLSRKTIEQELQNSLDRLGLDTIDLYQIHRWDYDTPIEETLRALDDAVRRGQVRYIGASSMWAHQFAEALSRSDHLFSFVVRRTEGRWACVSAHNTDVVPGSETNVVGPDGKMQSVSYRSASKE